MSKRYFVMVLGALALCLLVMAGLGGWSHLGLVLNVPSLIIIVVLPFLLSMAAFSWRQGVQAFRVSFVHVSAEEKQLKEALVFFEALGRYYLITALFGFFSGVISVLAKLGNPGEMGPSAALALLVIYYALLLELLVVLPFSTGLKKKLVEIA